MISLFEILVFLSAALINNFILVRLLTSSLALLMDKVVLFLSPYIDSNDVTFTSFPVLIAIVAAFVGCVIYKWFSADYIDQQDSAVRKVKKAKLKSKLKSHHVKNQGLLFVFQLIHYDNLH